MSIPITVGVTGHRDIPKENIEKIQQLVHEELLKIKYMCPNSELVMLNSIASGADTLCALEGLKLGYQLVCPLPVEKDIYRQDFNEEEAKVFDELILSAKDVFVAPHFEEEQEGRSYRFRQAGIYVATHCHVLLALWDGTEAKEDGCGTAEAVEFMLNRNHDANNELFSCGDGAVIHIKTPRVKNQTLIVPGVEILENTPDFIRNVLEKTDEFNADCMEIPAKERKLIDSDDKPKSLGKLEICNSMAAALSQHFQKKYLNSIKLLSVFSVLLVLTYLLYDNGGVFSMLIYYGVVLGLYYFSYKKIMRGKYHEKYICYRMLAECSRVQTFLSALNIKANTAQFYTWTQKQDAVWIKSAMDVLRTEEKSTLDRKSVAMSWIDDQLSYNRSAYKKNQSKYTLADKVSSVMLIVTLVLFLLVVILELASTDFMNHSWQGLEMRSWFKILWGSISAVTVFVSGFYGNLSLDRKTQDNRKMSVLFGMAEKKLDESMSDELFVQLAREEIIENGNWASYCMENKPIFNI